MGRVRRIVDIDCLKETNVKIWWSRISEKVIEWHFFTWDRSIHPSVWKIRLEVFKCELQALAAYSSNSIELAFICMDGLPTYWEALHFLSKCMKMSRWLACLKRAYSLVLSWHPRIVEICSKPWAMLSINYFL